MKKITWICTLLIMVMCLAGCDTDKSTAKQLLEGTINNTIKGKVSKTYMDINGGVASFDPANERNELQYEMVKYLQAAYAYEKPDDLDRGTTSSFGEVYEEILKNFEYEMSDLEKIGKGRYKATITYKPFALGDVLDPVAMEFYEEADKELEEEAKNPPLVKIDTGFSYIDRRLFQLLLEKTNEFAKDIKYSEEISTDVVITVTDSFWTLSDSYYYDFITSIIDLNLDEIEALEEELEESQEVEQEVE